QVPVPFLEDPYKAIRQSYLVVTEIPESPYTVASPTSLPESTPPTLHAEESEGSDMCDRMYGSAYSACDVTWPLFQYSRGGSYVQFSFRKMFRSSCESLPSSPPELLLQKHYQGTSELVEDDKEEDEEEEDKEVEESLDSDSKSEDTKEEGPAAEDEGLAARDEGIVVTEEGPGIGVESLGLGGDEAIPEEPERPERESALRQSTLTIWKDPEDGRAYIDVPAYPPPTPPVQTPPYPKRSLGSLPVSLAHSIVPSPISSPMIPLTVPSVVASPAMAETKGFLTELGARVKMQGGLIHDHTVRLGELSPFLFERYDRDIGEFFTRSGAVRDEIFSQRYQFRSLKHEQERVVIAEERRVRLDLAEIVDSMKRGKEPRGDV
ncbi:hypothetical protein Tco_1044269, partial [Tanacetum coccineum]